MIFCSFNQGILNKSYHSMVQTKDMLVISDNYFFQCSNLKICCKIGILGLDKKSDNSTSLHNKYPKLSEMKSQTFLSNNIDLIRNIRLGLLFHILKIGLNGLRMIQRIVMKSFFVEFSGRNEVLLSFLHKLHQSNIATYP